jgi:aminoethylphosphonate catabolism LysR family transcriptional regulator
MNYAQLRAFHAGSFTRAAQALHVTQPTLSAQVKELEASYGVRLFDRRGRRIEPTELGRSLLDVTRRLFSLETEAEQLLAATRGLKRGHLRVGADAPYHVMPALAAFGQKYPGVRLSLAIGNSEELLHDLFEHRSDVAVLADIVGDPRLLALPLRRDPLIAFVDRGHPWARRRRVRAAELAGQRLVLREPGSTTRRSFETAMARAGLALADMLEIGSREAVREAVLAGLGIAAVSEIEFVPDPRLRVVPIADADVKTHAHVACLVERRASRVVDAFFDVVDALLAAPRRGARREA